MNEQETKEYQEVNNRIKNQLASIELENIEAEDFEQAIEQAYWLL
jgi:hypothetical protein